MDNHVYVRKVHTTRSDVCAEEDRGMEVGSRMRDKRRECLTADTRWEITMQGGEAVGRKGGKTGEQLKSN